MNHEDICDVNPRTLSWAPGIPAGAIGRICIHCASRLKDRDMSDHERRQVEFAAFMADYVEKMKIERLLVPNKPVTCALDSSSSGEFHPCWWGRFSNREGRSIEAQRKRMEEYDRNFPNKAEFVGNL